MKMLKDVLLFALLMLASMFIAVLFSGGYYDMYGENFLLQLIEYPLIITVISVFGTKKVKIWIAMPCITFIVVNLFFLILFNTTYFGFVFAYTAVSLIISVLTSFFGKLLTD
ncbi:DUF2651 family protein [Bacillus marasmi]|uniref:DUF2651 family protein n=1 Tax=Bacillus marasmi TaxID=1926279 RepID=UPI0011C8AC07|nr:DUF2651 family protein [Bacillus marasmi]